MEGGRTRAKIQRESPDRSTVTVTVTAHRRRISFVSRKRRTRPVRNPFLSHRLKICGSNKIPDADAVSRAVARVTARRLRILRDADETESFLLILE